MKENVLPNNIIHYFLTNQIPEYAPETYSPHFFDDCMDCASLEDGS